MSEGLALMSYIPSFWVNLADVMKAYGELKICVSKIGILLLI